MATFSAKQIAAFKAQYEQEGFFHRVWTVDEQFTISLKDYGYMDPKYQDVQKVEVIERPYIDKKGRQKAFLKIEVFFNTGGSVEWDLPYNKSEEIDFEEGDLLDISTVFLKTETCTGEKDHKYMIGECK